MTNVIDLAKVLFPALAGIAAFCYYAAHLADKGASETTKSKLREVLKTRRLLPVTREAFAFFLLASDRFFGKRLFSRKAVLRSVALSFFWALGVLIVCVFVYPNYTSWLSENASRNLILKSAALLLAASLFADYLSVCVTRAIIRAAVGKRKRILLLAIVSDLVLTVLIFYALFSAAKWLLYPANAPLNLLDALRVWLNPAGLPVLLELLEPLTADMLVPRPGGFDIRGGLSTEIVYAFPESVLFLSSLLTSVWLWIYVLGYSLLFAAVRLDRTGERLRKSFKFDEDPIHGLAFAILVASVLLLVVILLIAGARNLLTPL